MSKTHNWVIVTMGDKDTTGQELALENVDGLKLKGRVSKTELTMLALGSGSIRVTSNKDNRTPSPIAVGASVALSFTAPPGGQSLAPGTIISKVTATP